ncbi:hypothetical protein BDQ12DRAFT_428534 [Crucibulum laeve]|uniref:Uncharacterized protein n=1 Tax=Crucibulum laeve TaxID=68775 RepID=A0A5C3M9N5_9AGAR|nr:hypothetical protein BDQ12DRAFT_428534 [Crucibulum laeve]
MQSYFSSGAFGSVISASPSPPNHPPFRRQCIRHCARRWTSLLGFNSLTWLLAPEYSSARTRVTLDLTLFSVLCHHSIRPFAFVTQIHAHLAISILPMIDPRCYVHN